MGTGRLGSRTASCRKRLLTAGGTCSCSHSPSNSSGLSGFGGACQVPAPGALPPPRLCRALAALAAADVGGSCSMAKLERPLLCSERAADSELPRFCARDAPPLLRRSPVLFLLEFSNPLVERCPRLLLPWLLPWTIAESSLGRMLAALADDQ